MRLHNFRRAPRPSTSPGGGMNFFLVRLAVWFVTLALFPIPVTLYGRSFKVEVLHGITLDAPASECTEPRCVDANLAERVLVRLQDAEKKEIDPWVRDDLRIAWITANWSQKGVPQWSWHKDSAPYVAATYQVLQCLPDEVWPRIVAKRKAQCGSLYSALYDENDLWRGGDLDSLTLPPKKSVARERRGIAAAEAA